MFRLLFLLLVCFSITSHADGIVRPALGYTIDKQESGGSATTTTRQLFDLAAGWMSQDHLMLLGMYSMENKTVADSSTSSSYNRTAFGAGIGWMGKAANAPYIDAIYHFSAQLATPGTKYTGTGWQLDLGYKFDVGKVGVGLQVTYRSFAYTKANGDSFSPAYKVTNLDPMFALVVVF